MEMDYTGPILALVVGWLLSEGSHLIRYRSQKKQTARVCLAELLQIRHRVIGNQFFFDRMEAYFELSPSQLIQVRNLMPKPLQNDLGASERLNAAIGNVAKYSPFLAFRLHGKDLVGVIEAAFNPREPQEEQFAENLLKAQRDFRENIIPELERAILATAWQSGFLDWIRAVKRVRYDARINPEAERVANESFASVVEQIEGQRNH